MVSIDSLGWRTGANGELLEKEKKINVMCQENTASNNRN